MPDTDPARRATVSRKTAETEITVTIDLDGRGRSRSRTGVGFFDHMIDQLARHSLIDIDLQATGDLHIDDHHTVEDVGITLGQAFAKAIGDKKGMTRYGHAYVPLDEALARAVVDVSGRPYLVHEGEPEGQQYHLIGGHFTGSMTRHVFESITYHAAICLHMDVVRGRDPHHIVEAQFKAFARALRAAVEDDPRMTGVPSTKGAL